MKVQNFGIELRKLIGVKCKLPNRQVQLYANETHPLPKDLFISCPFSDELYESMAYQLDYLVTGDAYNYTKQYVFNVPKHEFIGKDIDVRKYTPFVYIDTSYEPLFFLYIQFLPESYNVTEYRIWLINKDIGSVVDSKVFSTASKEENWYNLTGYTGSFFFKVSAVHPICGLYGCANSSTPLLILNGTSHHRLLIMIVSTVWIPPVLLYVLYHLYKLYKKEALQRREKPNCLLAYSPTRLTHINAMVELAKYLRNSNVTVIDTIDITDNTGKDPEYWCNAAFRRADVVLIVTSPPPKKPVVSIIYQGNDDFLFKLIRENRFEKEKRYYVVQLPYCKPDDLPEELRHFKKFSLPKELPKLVKAIHKIEQIGCISVCDKDFLDSVKLAKLEILEEDGNMVKETRETENLLTSENLQAVNNRNSMPKGSVTPQSFTTNIDELNLLGEPGEGGETFTYKNVRNNDTDAFCIDQLNL
ncbi:uncharacterized protein LOC143178374 isoform X2 [Calliopsis andreniformis]|uniref:uncharacterized protein LOC143178374 isoform X2 n=1 Tax=Calliopsis andreniformis TaxID=337506 RepID=UPI003FCDB4D7